MTHKQKARARRFVSDRTLADILLRANKAYGDDLVMYAVDGPDPADTLAMFIAIELLETFDPQEPLKEHYITAAGHMESAIIELSRVRDALLEPVWKMEEQEKANGENTKGRTRVRS